MARESQSPYILIPDKEFELTQPRERLESSTEFQVKQEHVVVDMHQPEPQATVDATSRTENQTEAHTKFQRGTTPRASIHDIVASPTHTTCLDDSTELDADSEKEDILTSLPSSPSSGTTSNRGILKKSSIVFEDSGSFSINGDTIATSAESSASYSYVTIQQGDESRRNSKVTFAATNPMPSSLSQEDNGNEYSIQCYVNTCILKCEE